MSDGYRADTAHMVRVSVLATGAGAALGAAVGTVRLRRVGPYVLVGALRGLGSCAAFFGVREGYRALAHVRSWREEWFELNTCAGATGGALLAFGRPAVQVAVGSALGATVALAGSLAYVWAMQRHRAARESSGEQTSDKVAWRWPNWMPLRPISTAEVEDKKERYRETSGR